MKPCILFLLTLIVSNNFIYAQREADNWYFGNGAGISFKSGAPVALTDGVINQSEGVATISDRDGNLLFYTDGATIWNRNHAIMQNGSGLFGDNQSAQSGVIVPMPNNPNIYYVFTVSNWPLTGTSSGLFYSIIDMSVAGGMGAVTSKNALLNASVREQVTSAFHANCRDVWIVSHEKGNANFLAYLLTPTGITSVIPVISATGMVYTGGNRYGYLRFSSDGNKLCSTLGYATGGAPSVETVQLFDFNKTTGVVSNPLTLAVATGVDRDAYSSEFSADNTKLYVCAYNRSFIYQYDLSSGNAATILASKVNIGAGPDIKSCLQMGPDKRIYVSKGGQGYLGMIRDPDKPGALCDYVNNAVSLNGKSAALGLPNFMQGFFALPYLGVDSSICPGASLLLNAYTRPGETYRWQDGSTNSIFTVTQAGQYWVEVNNNGCVRRDDIKIDQVPLPVVNLGADTGICGTATIQLDASVGAGAGATYLWQDGATTPVYTVSGPGNYSVTVTEKGCSNSDAIVVNTVSPPTVNLGNDTAICAGATLLLDAINSTGNTYKWQNGGVSSSLTVSLPGKYWVDVSNIGCKATDTIEVANKPGPMFYLGNDTTICSNTGLLLDASAAGASALYAWKDGSTASTFAVATGGEYWVKATDNGCSTSDTIKVMMFNPAVVNLGNDTTICLDQTLLLKAIAIPNATYTWQDGSTQPEYSVTRPGTYKVDVSTTCGMLSDVIVVKVEDCNCQVHIPNAFTPNRDYRNGVFKPIVQQCQFAEYNLKIFNRWGQRIFETSNPATGWDGSLNGHLCDVGAYVYMVTYRSGNNTNRQVRHGTLMLIR